MSRRTVILVGLAAFLIQFYLSGYITIKGIRPDFLLMVVIYVAMRSGSTVGVVVGFVMGLLEDLLSAGSLFGLAPLTKSLTGFLIGRLQGKFPRMSPLIFHMAWILIVLVHFFLYVYVRFQSVYESSQSEFWLTWLYAVAYTMIFVGIVQVIAPLHKVSPVE